MENPQERSDRHARMAGGILLFACGMAGLVAFMSQPQPSAFLMIGAAAVSIGGFLYAAMNHAG